LAFHGTFEHTLDAKHRLTVPSKFRSALAGRVVLVRAVDHCVAVYPAETYESMTQAALAGLNPFSPQARELKRMLYGNATDTELDSAGRVMLPRDLMEHGRLRKEVVVTGAGQRLEVWDRTAWAPHNASLADEVAKITASLGHAG
jgi:transcriptional regulator MraZ